MSRPAAVPLNLTKLETQAIRLAAEGATPGQISRIVKASDDTLQMIFGRIREKVGAATHEQMLLMIDRYHHHIFKGCVVTHGNNRALLWHQEHGIPICPPCDAFRKRDSVRSSDPESPRAEHRPYRRLSAVETSLNGRRGAPVDCGTIQAARRHIRAGQRISDATCGCREAYAEWYRQYQRQAG